MSSLLRLCGGGIRWRAYIVAVAQLGLLHGRLQIGNLSRLALERTHQVSNLGSHALETLVALGLFVLVLVEFRLLAHQLVVLLERNLGEVGTLGLTLLGVANLSLQLLREFDHLLRQGRVELGIRVGSRSHFLQLLLELHDDIPS